MFCVCCDSALADFKIDPWVLFARCAMANLGLVSLTINFSRLAKELPVFFVNLGVTVWLYTTRKPFSREQA
jgi:hypothetical protein